MTVCICVYVCIACSLARNATIDFQQKEALSTGMNSN